MDAPLVSVIIPAYNAQHYIGDALDSILNQDWLNLEVIVVDDGSTDGTREVVERYVSRVTYLYQANSGSCAAPRNHGLAKCRGQYIAFLDADDLMTSDRLASQVEFLEGHLDVGLVFSDYVNFDGNGPCHQTHFSTCPKFSAFLNGRKEVVIDDARHHLIKENFGIASSFMIRREMLRAVPAFDESLKASEDFNFYYRVTRHTKTGVINRVGMMRRRHDSNMSGDMERMLRNSLRSYSQLRETESDSRARKLLDELGASRWANLARHHANSGMFGSAFRHYFQALFTAPGWDTARQVCNGFARTFAMMSGLHKPDER
ncbi:MAG: glycosyltransferase [Chromatiales bacterium]|jgi:glycosyltransferase involved in cell wall biosynthesis|nr:glycosyltransferase [Chromatiales bacterium]